MVLILPAAGASRRMGEDKLWADICGRPLLGRTFESVAAAAGLFQTIMIATPRRRWPAVRALATGAGLDGVRLIEGGDRRQGSVRRALDLCPVDAEVICIHDAARPLCSPEIFASVLDAARRWGAATAATGCADSIKRVSGDLIVESLDRDQLVAVQTPQAFRAPLLRAAHLEEAAVDDDAALVEHLGEPVVVVAGDQRNLKATRPADLTLIRALVSWEGR